MKSLINSSKLQHALGRVLSVVEKRSPRPMLSYALIHASTDNTLSVSATDMEVSAKVSIRGIQVDEEGTFCINPKNLFDILRELPVGDMEAKLEENTLKIQKEAMSYSFLTYQTDNFPHLSFEHGPHNFLIRGESLQRVISKVSHAISSEEGRIHLNGIFLSEYEGRLRSVSTDGNRLAMLDTNLKRFGRESLKKEGIIVRERGSSN